MKYSINESSSKFAYIQIYEQIKDDIVNGVIKFGSKLPSKRLLSEETGVSVITIEHAYSILCDEGYAESRERSGYYVIYKESDFNLTADYGFTPSYSEISVTETDCDFPYSLFAKTVRKVLSDKGEKLLLKSPEQGLSQLRCAIASYLKRSNGITVSPNQIIIGAGTEYLYSLIVQLLSKDRIYAIEKPSYDKILQVYRAHSVKTEMLSLGKNGIRTTELQKSQATVLHITPFNSFPSGVTANVSKRHEYLRWAEERGGYIIEDNYSAELTVSKKNEDTVFSMDKCDRVIYLNTFSQTITPSVRAGYMVLPPSLLDKFNKNLGFYSCTVPVLEQYVLAELIESGNFERHINRIRRRKRKAK